ncbi:E3 ubiquitin-protein ligase At4g11680-like [Magnolia sinica]|uniref:E3 ubiquitin-protein ligase At4g11680-like n=1 Tax=Magnolia sinica TaxID=86752 RepID=UPI00265B5529|nr:E3 ubiquitin-protein ligase At4g11680-like [Magnolia sinica]
MERSRTTPTTTSASLNSAAADDIIDSTPFLGSSSPNRDDDRSRRFSRVPSLRGAARFLRQASSGRMMREPSMLVRETAAEQLEERQSDWAYSRPVVLLDILWNLAFVGIVMAVLVLSRDESPSMPLRLWIVGYALQCVVHMVCVGVEYRRRHLPWRRIVVESRSWGSTSSGGRQNVEEVGEEYAVRSEDAERTSVPKHLESANTIFSFIWWIIGFYWVSAGGQTLTHDAPQLYWLCIVFLAFDVFFVVFCVALACVISIAVCCCLPCIIAILYAVADQEGASDEDIRKLPKYKFQRIGNFENLSGEISEPFGGTMTECSSEMPTERVLSAEDAECCICLSAYDDGVELRELPCGHHFHYTCIDKWLYINATCPLCKYNIIKSASHGREEV